MPLLLIFFTRERPRRILRPLSTLSKMAVLAPFPLEVFAASRLVSRLASFLQASRCHSAY